MKLRFMMHQGGLVNLSEIDYLQEGTKKYAGNKNVTYVVGYSGRPDNRRSQYHFGPCKLEDIISYINGRGKKSSKGDRFSMATADCNIEADDQDYLSNFCILSKGGDRIAINLLRIVSTRESGRRDDDNYEEEDEDASRRRRRPQQKRIIVFKSNISVEVSSESYDNLLSKMDVVERV